MDFLELLHGQLDENMISQSTRHIGASDPQQTQAAASGILSTLMAGVNKNASRPDGADSLVSAIDRDHDGSILNDVAGFLPGKKQPQNPNMLNDTGIQGHILGGQQGTYFAGIRKH